jgi:plastocyanin
VSSGLQPLGTPAKPFEMSFSKAGTYQYYCVIHPNMVGTLDVVAAGAKADAPADVASRGATERAAGLAEGQAAKKVLLAKPVAPIKNADGSSLWRVEMGVSTAHTDVLAFQPVPLNIKAGDTVTFVNNSGAPHTASFFGTGAIPIQDPTDPKVDPPAPGPSPQTLTVAGFTNTGLLPPNAPPGAGPPESARSFSLKVPGIGTYSYVCILHAPSNMVGTLVAS